MERIPLSDILGDRNGRIRVEESWSKDVPNDVGAGAEPVKEINRDSLIESALKRQSGRRTLAVPPVESMPPKATEVRMTLALDRGQKAIALAKLLQAKKMVKLKSVEQFTELVDILIQEMR